jgi:hypothetical protein
VGRGLAPVGAEGDFKTVAQRAYCDDFVMLVVSLAEVDNPVARHQFFYFH